MRDGYIAVLDEHGLRVVAEGFHFTNEMRLDAREEWLYIVETTGPHISRMRLVEGARGVALAEREVFGPADLGGPPDGIAFDAFGNLWCTLVMVDRLVALTPQGDVLELLDDGDPEASRTLVRKMADGNADARGHAARPRHAGAVAGQRDLRRPRSEDRLPGQPDGQHHPELPLAGGRVADGALERSTH